MTARPDSNAIAESLHGARAADRESEIESYRADAPRGPDRDAPRREVDRLRLPEDEPGQILIEWPGVDIEEPAKRLVAALTAPGDATAALGDLQLGSARSPKGGSMPTPSGSIGAQQEMIAAAREGYDESANEPHGCFAPTQPIVVQLAMRRCKACASSFLPNFTDRRDRYSNQRRRTVCAWAPR